MPGQDTIIYTVSNICGVRSVLFPFYVKGYTECHTGINPVLNPDADIYIYPNPADHFLNIISEKKIGSIAITNILGQKIFNHLYSENEAQINLGQFPSGVYFISINESGKRMFVKN